MPEDGCDRGGRRRTRCGLHVLRKDFRHACRYTEPAAVLRELKYLSFQEMTVGVEACGESLAAVGCLLEPRPQQQRLSLAVTALRDDYELFETCDNLSQSFPTLPAVGCLVPTTWDFRPFQYADELKCGFVTEEIRGLTVDAAVQLPRELSCRIAANCIDSYSVQGRLPAEQRGRRLILVTEQAAVGEMRALLAVGADVRARGGARGWTALHVAASRGDVEATRLLVDAGAAVDARSTWQQWTPLRVAAERDRAAVARLLLRGNADHKARDGSGWTPLHLAARCGNAEVAAALLEAGAERDATTGDSGATAVDLARENKDSRLMEMLS
ncbi:ankyrin repeat and protein kinase domain-containing protein 1-like [Schistocerca serialis cubense]|uniref:ankyrin repeat and protein kinase domain-containing protein 1-like n=1 Tax=Schistocerca serialis cubense TaxID=2023355 RepID=UPI00214E9E2A|nr:ankyrin repeat and protein kinase domain-containing protein 1-like [Schistocerca serialis cubense]